MPKGLTFNTKTGIIHGKPANSSPATNYTVTAYNTRGSSTTAVNIQVNPSVTEAHLNTLALSPKTKLTKIAGPNFADYTATVTYATNTIKVIPVAKDSVATITVNGIPATSGKESAAIALNADTNAIAVTVTAQDRVTKNIYRIVVTRVPSSIAVLTSKPNSFQTSPFSYSK